MKAHPQQLIQIVCHQARRLWADPSQARLIAPVFAHGGPGTGKSAAFEQAARALGVGFRDLRLSQYEPTDLRGLPVPRDGFTTWLPSAELPWQPGTRGILLLQTVADALSRIVHLGITSPVTDVMFDTAKSALHGVLRHNEILFRDLDVERFFFSVRPYYKPYRVGRQEYRGANAGDFSGINEIDLLLGLCSASDPYYAQLLVDKMLFMMPADQARLRECMTYRSLLDELLAVPAEHH